LIRPRDPELRLRLEHAGRGHQDVLIALERGVEQVLQLLVLEDLPPSGVAERRSGGRRLGAADDVR